MKHIQSFCESLGKNGCYFFCLVSIAEEVTGQKYNELKEAERCIKKGYMKYNYDNPRDEDNFYIMNPAKILEHLTGETWLVRKESSDYELKPKDYAVEFWSINGVSGHFARMYKGFNSLYYSNNVRNGKIKSYRIFNIVG